MNNTELKQYQKQQALEQEQLVGYWIKRFGISQKALNTHPQIDDVMLLIKFRSEFWDLNNYRKTQFARMWNWVYEHKLPLKKKHLKQLNHMGTQIIKWRKKRIEDVDRIKAFKTKHRIGN